MKFMFAACLLAFFTSFLLFGQVSLWLRWFESSSHIVWLASGFVLTMCAVGVSQGFRLGKQFCRARDLWEVCGIVFLAASLFDLIGPWIAAAFQQGQLQMLVGGVLIALIALLKAMLIPIAQQLDLSPSLWIAKRSVSRVYLTAFLGGILGLFFAKMILLSLLSIPQCFILFAVAAFSGSVFCLKESVQPVTHVMINLFAVVIFGFIVLQEAALFIVHPAVNVMQGRGVVLSQQDAVDDALQNEVLIFGDNSADVRASLYSVINSSPAMLLSVLQVPPQNVLMIGVSSGVWLSLLTRFPEVKNIDVVEINPSYLAAFRQSFHQQKKTVWDSRLHLSVEDGRHWLKSHPKQQYDLIVMNTTCYWRTCAARLLSHEFLALVQQHTKTGGAMAYNATASRYVLKATAIL
jgi:spermidine synthase